MDPKTEVPIREANLTVDDRLQELDGRIRIQQGILAELDDQTSQLDSSSNEIVQRTRVASQKETMANSDLDWFLALRETNLSKEQILDIWKKKDEISAKEKQKVQSAV